MCKPKFRIESIKVRAMADESPDTSYLGEYTETYNDWAIYRPEGEYCAVLNEQAREAAKAAGEEDWEEAEFDFRQTGREYAYFMPYAGGEKPGTEDYQNYGKQDFARMESLNNGDWYYMGIQAKAVVSYPSGGDYRRLETFTSGGLWGIESDSGDYTNTVKADELNDLRNHLKEFGIKVPNRTWEKMTSEIEIDYR